ncbi:hypothetical protein C5C39_10115 [Rathayibacter sp. AY1F3]|nr:hypothetical protein C5C39_10115 [Rathayibacter sp. AY1F3]
MTAASAVGNALFRPRPEEGARADVLRRPRSADPVHDGGRMRLRCPFRADRGVLEQIHPSL